MSKMQGYWVDIGNIQLGDSGNTWIQALPYGTYKHPTHGNIVIDSERAQRFASNINNKVRDTELDIDYDHKIKDTRAAGWMKSATVKEDGLWVEVEWTEEARSKLADKQYKYFSPEFIDEWKHPKTGQVHKDVMFGGALTNRPFLKDILPINLSELTESEQTEVHMEKLLKALRERYSLAEDADVDAVLTALSEDTKPEPPKASDAKVTTLNDGSIKVEIPGVEGEVTHKFEEPPNKDDANLKKLADENPAIKAMLDEREADRQRIERLEASHTLSEVNENIVSLREVSDKRRLSPDVEDELRKLMVKLGDTERNSVTEILTKIAKDGLVELGERAKGGSPKSESDNVVDQVNKKAVKLAEEKEITYNNAVKQLFREEPGLYEAYTEAVKNGS